MALFTHAYFLRLVYSTGTNQAKPLVVVPAHMGDSASKVLPLEEENKDPALFVGNLDFLIDPSVLSSLSISCIVSCLPSLPAEMIPLMNEGYEHLLFQLDDDSDAYSSLFHGWGVEYAVDWIHSSRKDGYSVLVHCDGGRTRSPSVVVAYLMKYGYDLHTPSPTSYKQALSMVTQRREGVEVRHFHDDLVSWEKLLQSRQAAEKNDKAQNALKQLRKDSMSVITKPDVIAASWVEVLNRFSASQLSDMFYERFFALGGEQIQELFETVPEECKKKMFSTISELAQGKKKQDVHNQLKLLVAVHEKHQLREPDFSALRKAMTELLGEVLATDWTPELHALWYTALSTITGRLRLYMHLKASGHTNSRGSIMTARNSSRWGGSAMLLGSPSARQDSVISESLVIPWSRQGSEIPHGTSVETDHFPELRRANSISTDNKSTSDSNRHSQEKSNLSSCPPSPLSSNVPTTPNEGKVDGQFSSSSAAASSPPKATSIATSATPPPPLPVAPAVIAPSQTVAPTTTNLLPPVSLTNREKIKQRLAPVQSTNQLGGVSPSSNITTTTTSTTTTAKISNNEDNKKGIIPPKPPPKPKNTVPNTTTAPASTGSSTSNALSVNTSNKEQGSKTGTSHSNKTTETVTHSSCVCVIS